VGICYNRNMNIKKPKQIDGCEHWLCPCCKEWKTSDGFPKATRARNGLSSYCRKCHAFLCKTTVDKINKRRLNREYARRARKADPEKFRARGRANSKKVVAANGPAYRAYKKLHSEINKGNIEKPTRCSSCNRKHKLTAHHEDYSKPLDVEWLCYECHGKRHWKD
jgi:hypothetical protein